MLVRRLVWLAVPLLGVLELVLHQYFSTRAPGPEEWAGLRSAVERTARPGDVIVVAPRWAEPLARQALGERWMPLSHVTSDLESHATALEVGLLGAEADDLGQFRELSRAETARFRLRRLENRAYRPALYRFVDHVRPDTLRVAETSDAGASPCTYTEQARPSTGGLGGHVAYPRARFRCSGGEPFFVGVTVVDDQRYRPRRCIFAHPLQDAALVLEFAGVPLGRSLAGSTGTSYLIARDGIGTDVELRAFVEGRAVGVAVQRDEQGFRGFDFSVPDLGRTHGNVRFEIRSADAHAREFCFTAEMR